MNAADSLLVIDVGNTETKLGFFRRAQEGLHLHKTWRVTTARRRTADEFGVLFAALFRRADIPFEAIRSIVISSVVPQNDRALDEGCRTYFGVAPHFFSAASQHLMRVETDRPRELGADLLAAAVAARSLYGTPLVVVGFGTATTFGAVSREGAYLGAAIAPGIQISIDALVERTSKLPHVALEAPAAVIGRDTVTALQSGIVYGFAGQAEAIVARMRRELGEGTKVVATGGLADIVASNTASIDAVEPHLVLFGLREYFEREIAATVVA